VLCTTMDPCMTELQGFCFDNIERKCLVGIWQQGTLANSFTALEVLEIRGPPQSSMKHVTEVDGAVPLGCCATGPKYLLINACIKCCHQLACIVSAFSYVLSIDNSFMREHLADAV
jgi:hypothetical protein